MIDGQGVYTVVRKNDWARWGLFGIVMVRSHNYFEAITIIGHNSYRP